MWNTSGSPYRRTDLVPEVPVRGSMHSSPVKTIAISVGSSPKRAVPQTSDRHPICHQKVERVTVFTPASHFLLHELSTPSTLSLRTDPLRPEDRGAL